MTLPDNNSIIGVELKPLRTFPDGRGFFREIIRSTESVFADGSFRQWSHSKMQKNVVKAWHYHHIQTDWWYVPVGQTQIVLFDNREESPTYGTKLDFMAGESDKYGSDTHEVCVRIPPGVLHSIKVLSDEAHLFYITSEIYNPDDEGRFPYDNGPLDHSWGSDVITSERDRVAFIPTSPRPPIGAM